MSRRKFNAFGEEEQNLTAIIGVQLLDGFIKKKDDYNNIKKEILSFEDASIECSEFCKECSVLVHTFYNIIYEDKDDLKGKYFYTNDKKSPCLKKFEELLHKDRMSKKMVEYAISEALAMVKSDIEKEKEHETYIEEKKEELEEIDKKIYNIEHRSICAKRLQKIPKLRVKKAAIQRKIDTPFSSKRTFGTKSLRERIDKFVQTEKNKKINRLTKEIFDEEKKTNKELTFDEVKKRFTSVSFTAEEWYDILERREELLEEYRHKRYGSFKSHGDANIYGNRFFRITEENGKYYILFCPSKYIQIKFLVTELHGYEKLFEKMYQMSRVCQVPLTFNLDFYKNQIQISYDPIKLYGREEWEKIKPKPRRIASVDLNPGESGLVIADFYGKNGFMILRADVFSVQELNELEKALDDRGLNSSDHERKHLTNKRHYEIDIICKDIMNLVSHYRCETFAIEKLKFNKKKNGGRGHEFNKLVNKFWCRKRFYDNIKRECYIRKVEFKEVNAAYSSFVGNFLFRSLGLPDMCLAALEIGRRAYRIKEFYMVHRNQKDTPDEEKENFILPDSEDFKSFVKDSWNDFLPEIEENPKKFGFSKKILDLNEELEHNSKKLLKKIYDAIGTKMVRVHLDDLLSDSKSDSRVHRLHTEKSHTERIIFDCSGFKVPMEKDVYKCNT